MNKNYFQHRDDVRPMIYAYEIPGAEYRGLLKVGYTEKSVEERVAQQFPTKRPDGTVPYRIVFQDSAMRNDGSCFTDHDVHRMLRKKQITGVGGEWFRCTTDDLRAAVIAVKNRSQNEENRTQNFGMRPEQKKAVEKTIHYYQSAKKDFPDRAPKFLWNAKMRFGKTFASYQLAREMRSLLRLVDFYEANKVQLEATRTTLKVNDLPYPQMKMLDMGFWQIGFELDTKKGLKNAH